MSNDKDALPELLPCPFCGGETRVDARNPNGAWIVRCWKEASCAGRGGAYPPDMKAEAIAAWNRRAPIPDQRSDAEDAAMLDWIGRQGDEYAQGMLHDQPGDGDYFVHGMGDCMGQGKTFRDAIRAAMSATTNGDDK